MQSIAAMCKHTAIKHPTPHPERPRCGVCCSNASREADESWHMRPQPQCRRHEGKDTATDKQRDGDVAPLLPPDLAAVSEKQRGCRGRSKRNGRHQHSHQLGIRPAAVLRLLLMRLLHRVVRLRVGCWVDREAERCTVVNQGVDKQGDKIDESVQCYVLWTHNGAGDGGSKAA